MLAKHPGGHPYMQHFMGLERFSPGVCATSPASSEAGAGLGPG